ncbi:MAG: biopolymer transporter ExbD [Salinivirgaceae bacterium]|nr:MAG: biopolymer transporter ExbD [Salinivirgaceae bacterium]
MASKFQRKGKSGDTPGINTASLPDIVFMLLFFFMVSTTMREQELKIQVRVPDATEIQKLEKKSLVSYIYVGEPKRSYQRFFGSEPRIQLNDAFKQVKEIPDYVAAEREARDENERPFMTTSLKIDYEVKMGIVTDIKQELRKANALKINYSSKQKTE